MARMIGYALLMGTLTFSPAASFPQDKEMLDPHLPWCEYRDFYPECMDGDGEKETIVDVFADREGTPVQRYRTRMRRDGGGYVWAIRNRDGTFVDFECNGKFRKLGPGEELVPPECAGKR